MTYEEIIEKLKEVYKGSKINEFAYLEQDNGNLGLGQMEEVAQKGGESQGSEWYSVKYFKDHDIYIKVEGYYSSYEGTHFDGWDNSCSECRPQLKQITVYE